MQSVFFWGKELHSKASILWLFNLWKRTVAVKISGQEPNDNGGGPGSRQKEDISGSGGYEGVICVSFSAFFGKYLFIQLTNYERNLNRFFLKKPK